MTHEEARRTVLGCKVLVQHPKPGVGQVVGAVASVTYPFADDPIGAFYFDIETEDGDYLLEIPSSEVVRWKKQDWSPRTGRQMREE